MTNKRPTQKGKAGKATTSLPGRNVVQLKQGVAQIKPDTQSPQVSPDDLSPDDFYIVGLGASAGGLEAFTKFFDALAPDTGMAFVLIQHLDPTHKSMMVDLLSAHTSMPVQEAVDAVIVEPDHIYIIPPGSYLTVHDGALRLTKPHERHGARLPFDFFLKSLADDFGPRAICAVLSGTGSDGSDGIKAIHDKGGFILAQDPTDASQMGMPNNAILTGTVSLTLPVSEMPAALVKYARHGHNNHVSASSTLDADTKAALAEIVDILHKHTQRNFSLYKEGTLLRQIQRRMATISIRNVDAYMSNLRDNPDEIEVLANNLLINVTRFFRDPVTFEVLAETVIPEMIRHQPQDRPLRIWDAGCSTGEETYSIVMLLLEEMSTARRNLKLQIFASDIDPEAIAIARDGVYPKSIEDNVSQARLERFFTKEIDGYHVTRELRDAVIFTIHDILTDAPFSRLDLVMCRNVLIYLQPDAQENVLSLFHFTLREGGILVLGGSETISSIEDRFEAISRKQRIFRHLGRSRAGEVQFPFVVGDNPRSSRSSSRMPEHKPARPKAADIARQALLDTYAPASVLINTRYEGLYFFGPVDRYLMVTQGAAHQDIFALARKGLLTRLRAATREAERDHASVSVRHLQMERDGSIVDVSLTVQPIQIDNEAFLLVSFADEPAHNERTKKLPADGDTLLERELDATRKELEYTILDLGVAHDELAATAEEAMSVKEEFQSTNEELETSKEELQSLNEELTALNAQLAETIERQHATANDLKNTLNSSQIAALFLDTDLNIRFFTPAAREMFRIIPSDIGRPLTDLARLTNDTHLISGAKNVLVSHDPISGDIEGDNGMWYTRRILPYRTQTDEIQGVVVTYGDISQRKAAEQAIDAARAYSDSIINTIRKPLVVLDEKLFIISASPSFYAALSITPEDTVGRKLDAIDKGHLNVKALRQLLDHLSKGEGFGENYEIDLDQPLKEKRSLRLFAQKISGPNLTSRNILLTFDDITESKKINAALEAAKYQAEQANLGKSRFLAAASHDLRQPLQTLSLLHGVLAKRISNEDDTQLVARLGAAIDVMSDMLNTLLDINQLEAGIVRPTIVDFWLGDLLERLKTDFTDHTVMKGLDWRVVMSSLKVRSDPHLLEQMLRNLLSNAVKYTATGKVLLGCRRRGDTLRIEVWDTGMGVSEEQREAIFDEFHQIDNPARERSRGLGLGLSIVQRISDLLAHPLNVRSWLGAGSVFSIEIPLVEKGSDIWRQKISIKDKTAKNYTGSILIIEDDPMVRDALTVLFEAEQYQTKTFATSAEAIEQTGINNNWPDVIISDYNLPGRLTGTDVVTKLRKSSSRKIPAIILTGDISNGTLLEIGYADCVHFRKPVKADEMLRHVMHFLAAKPQPTKTPAKDEAHKPAKSPSAGASSTIFLVDDDQSLLTDMKTLLVEHGMTVEAYSGAAEFLDTVKADRQGCLVVDAVMPGMGGIELLEHLNSENRKLPAIMVTGYGDVAMAVEAMRVGAEDFLEKPVNADQLIASIQRALDHAGDASKNAAWRDAATERLARLTPREREIMTRVISGQPNKIIAFDLGISRRTVENHRAAIMKRTEVKSLPDLVRLVMAAEAE